MEDYNEKSYHAVIARLETRLDNIDKNIASINTTTTDIQTTLSKKISDMDLRVKVLEYFKYWLLGATAGIGVIFNLFFPKVKAFFAAILQ